METKKLEIYKQNRIFEVRHLRRSILKTTNVGPSPSLFTTSPGSSIYLI